MVTVPYVVAGGAQTNQNDQYDEQFNYAEAGLIFSSHNIAYDYIPVIAYSK